MAENKTPVSHMCKSEVDGITVRGHDLVTELMGERTFTEVFFLLMTGRLPAPPETRLVDAVLLSLMEHGMMPQSIAARMVALCEPEALQAAVAAGLLGMGSRFGGPMSGTAVLLDEINAATDKHAAAQDVVQRFISSRQNIPGFGHPLHNPVDPRAQRLLQIAHESKISGMGVEALKILSQEVDAGYGRHLTVNAPGAIAAVLLDLGFPAWVMRGFAVVSRSAGLVAHLVEEKDQQVAMFLSKYVEREIDYVDTSTRERK